MQLCNKCFKNNCNCIDKELVEIDDLMVDTIRILNEKGYKTLFCCSGHYIPGEDIQRQVYIIFNRAYLFENFKQYKLDSKYKYRINHNGAFVHIRTTIKFEPNDNIVPENKKEEYIKEVNKDFYNWAVKLPTIKEHVDSVHSAKYEGKKSLDYSYYSGYDKEGEELTC